MKNNKTFVFNGIKFIYTEELDGGASYHANLFMPVIRHFNTNRGIATKYNKCLEMFAGVGITGLILVLEGLCNSVDLVDINPAISEYALSNIKNASLESKANLIISDLFEGVNDKRYDLIIGNPPRISDPSKIQPSKFLKAADIDYSLHQKFLEKLYAHLNPNGLALLLEDWKNMPVSALHYLEQSHNKNYRWEIVRPTLIDSFRGASLAFKGRGSSLQHTRKSFVSLPYETIRWRRHFYFIKIMTK